MKKSLASLGLASLALSLAAPAQAGVSADFAGCDGLKKPKRSDDGMRGEATISAFRSRGSDVPSMVVASCNRALESGKLLKEQTLRRAHIMRARAAAKLQMGDLDGALTDLDAADAAGSAYASDFFYKRSMGVSIDLLRAIALNDSGKRDEALALAQAALETRPYALAVQRVGTMLRAGNDDTPTDPLLWRELAQIDPATRRLSAGLAATPSDLATLAANAGDAVVVMPDAPSIQALVASGGNATPLINEWMAPVNQAMRTAYALAAAGDAEAARDWVEATRSALTLPEAEDGKKPEPLVALLTDTVKGAGFVPMETLVDARIALAEGRFADAAGKLDSKRLRSSSLTDEFYAAYAAAEAPDGVEKPDLAPLAAGMERSAPKLAQLADDLLMRPESERKLIDYQKSRPNILGALVGGALSMGTSLLGGIPRTSGFKETENENGSIKVEYTGDTTSGAVVQEMTLLRAAEVAQAAGKSHFHITGRNDYQRYLTQLLYGVEQSRTLTGYKTEMTIRLLDDTEAQPQAIDAVTIIDALGPVYYGD